MWPNPQWPEPRLSVKPCWDLLSMVHDIPILPNGTQLFQASSGLRGGGFSDSQGALPSLLCEAGG